MRIKLLRFKSVKSTNDIDLKLVKKKLHDMYSGNYNNLVFVAPDAGAAKRTFSFDKYMGVKTCIMHKELD